ncbi:ribonuclease HII [Halobacteriales archaeon QS_4_62_28]|nr:MAG: ribonuclease HII [Halobacteriales archaeon QS_4_62_28]
MRFGIDEAGKGPVLGSMFAAAVRCDPAVLPAAVGDSKGIPEERRERLAEQIWSVATVGVAEIPPARIDDPETDMNTLTVIAHAEALEAVATDGLAGVADAGDTNAVRFEQRVRDRIDADIDLTAKHQADEDEPLVGAASIVAKTAREAHVDALAAKYGPIGSGYPSDPTTREFLEGYVTDHGDLPDCARRTWATCEDVLAASQQSSLDSF